MQSSSEKAKAFVTMLENTKHYDPDIRHTGALDLCSEIVKSNEQLEESLEKKICTAFIAHLEDQSLEVKSNAVRCIQRVSSKIREANLVLIV
jgi:tellurite resistance protein